MSPLGVLTVLTTAIHYQQCDHYKLKMTKCWTRLRHATTLQVNFDECLWYLVTAAWSRV